MTEEVATEEVETPVTEADAGENEVIDNEAEVIASAEDSEAADSTDDSASSEDSSGEDDKPPRKRNRISAKDRIAQLTAKNRELERELASRPDPDDYAGGVDSPEYRQKEIEYAVATRLQQEKQASQQQAITEKFNSALHKAAETYGDDTVADAFEYVGTNITREIASAIKESDKAGDILVHLANNPDELHSLNSMSPYAAAMKIGQISAGLSSNGRPAPQTKTVTNAPPPPTTVGSNNAPDGELTEDISQAEYERRARKRRGGSIYA